MICPHQSREPHSSVKQHRVSLSHQLISFVAPLVEVRKVQILCPERPGGNIVLDLKKKTDKSGNFKVDKEYVLKEGSLNCMELTLQVHNDIVYGLKFAVFLKKMGMNVH